MNGIFGRRISSRTAEKTLRQESHIKLTKQFVRDYVERRMPPDLTAPLSVSDVVQSVMLLVFRNEHKFRGRTEDELHGWLARISERKIIDSRRRYRPRCCPEKLRGEFEPDPDGKLDQRRPDTWVGGTEEYHRLVEAIELLPDEIRRVVLLRYRDNDTFEKIAIKCGIPTTTCRRRWVSGLRLLAKNLLDQEQTYGAA